MKKKKLRISAMINIITMITDRELQSRGTANATPIQVQVSNPSDSIVTVDGEINMRPTVPPMTQNFTSTNAGAAVTVYFMNEDTYNLSPTTNGGGAGTVVKTYGDGWSGLGYNALAKSLSAKNGIPCYGFTFQFITTSTGAQDASGLNAANPTWLMANLVGNRQIPVGFVLSSGARNTQYLAGEMTVKARFNMSPMNQLSYNLPINSTCALTVLTKPF